MAISVERHQDGSVMQKGSDSQYNEVIVITGLTSRSVGNELLLYDEIINHADFPKWGEQLSSPFTYLYMRNARIERTGCDPSAGEPWVQCTVDWRKLDLTTQEPDETGPGLITTGASLETLETIRDRFGALITVSHNGETDVVPVSARLPKPVLSFSRVEEFNPRAKSRAYTGKVNNAPWNGYAARTILCTGIVGSSSDGGVSYDVRYTFEEEPDEWNPIVAYRDKATGEHPSTISLGDGMEEVDLYEPVSFVPLNISL